MYRVVYIKEVKRVWDSLTSYYKGSDKVKKVRFQTLRKKYELLQMDSTELIKDFFSKTLSLVNEMKANGATIDDTAIIEKILHSLPKKFESKVTAIEECNTVSDMKIDEVLGSLQSNEQIMLEKFFIRPVEEALQSQTNWNSRQQSNSTKSQDVKFGNNALVPVMGKGMIAIILKNGSQAYITDVFYVPGLHQNLLSMGQLSERGYSMHIEGGICTIHDKRKRLIAKVQMTKN
ncbi:uncharacterized protein LOC113339436 [Papaver somniferum]|uniref:uncharacterized protein LOC113339436 n=1 Tax=Papaver somniferum TaxID=3469 RepID=UPI000E6F760B|nr:uncharacterized protein LOC113339436 [Papaver somniferum]